MTEEEARAEVDRIVGPAATERLARFAALIVAENDRQNLIARSTISTIWARHLLDSIQLTTCAGPPDALWIDIGTGGGFPGLAIAIATGQKMVLVEPRKQRAVFLTAMSEAFGLTHVRVDQRLVERLPPEKAAILSARAVSPMHELFDKAIHCSGPATRWILPRGVGWQNDIAAASIDWSATFHVEQSLSDPDARVVTASGVTRR